MPIVSTSMPCWRKTKRTMDRSTVMRHRNTHAKFVLHEEGGARLITRDPCMIAFPEPQPFFVIPEPRFFFVIPEPRFFFVIPEPRAARYPGSRWIAAVTKHCGFDVEVPGLVCDSPGTTKFPPSSRTEHRGAVRRSGISKRLRRRWEISHALHLYRCRTLLWHT